MLAALSGNLGLIPNIFVIAYHKQASRGKQREAERERHERGETGQREAESGVVVGRGSRHSKADLAFTVELTGYTQPHRIPTAEYPEVMIKEGKAKPLLTLSKVDNGCASRKMINTWLGK